MPILPTQTQGEFMYYVIDTRQLLAYSNAEEARTLRADLQRDNPDANWLIVHDLAPPAEPNALERLYALAHQLLRVSGIDPYGLKATFTNLIGEEQEFSAVRIMHDARAVLDTTA